MDIEWKYLEINVIQIIILNIASSLNLSYNCTSEEKPSNI